MPRVHPVRLAMAWSWRSSHPSQPASRRATCKAGLMATTQPAGIPNHRVTPPIEREDHGTGGGGRILRRRRPWPSKAKSWAGGAISTPQHFYYNWREDYTAESRDVFLGANVRWRPAATRYLELVGGGGLAINMFANRSIVRTEPLAIPAEAARATSEPDEVSTTDVQLALNGGVPMPLPVGRKIEVVPAFTVRWVGGPSTGSAAMPALAAMPTSSALPCG